MQLKGIKRGNNIELLKELNIPDGQEVIIEVQEENSQSNKKSSFWEDMQKFRQEENIEAKGIESEVFGGVRDKYPVGLELSILSESALQKDWLKPEEDEAWQNL